MSPDSREAGHWICFAPREHVRERNYMAVSQDPVQPPEVISAFELLAESALPLKGSAAPLWQYLFLGPLGYSLLVRGSVEARGGASARVVWGLLLPFRFVTSPGFCLEACTKLFPPESYSRWPASIDFDSLPHPGAPDEEAAALAAAFLDSGKLRVNMGAADQALTLFCRAIEQLPPADRLTASFATLPVGKRALEADPHAGPLPASASGQGRALLKLWETLKGQVQALPDTLPDFPPEIDKHVYRSVSLAGEPGSWPWLACLLRAPGGFVTPFRQFANELKDLPRPVQDAVLTGGFDGYMAQAAPADVAAALDQLQQARLLEAGSAGDDLIPPLKPIMAATRRGVLGAVQPATLATLLTGQSARGKRTEGVVRYLLRTLQEDSAAENRASDVLGDLVTGLRGLPRGLPADDEFTIAARCQENWVQMRAALNVAAQNTNPSSPPLPGLAAALGSLALHAAARERQIPTAALQRFLQELDADP